MTHEDEIGPKIDFYSTLPIEELMGRLEEPSDEWDIIRDEYEEDFGQRIEIRNGKISFDLMIQDGWAEIGWDAIVPSDLKPGGGYNGYKRFIDLISRDFPNKVFVLPSVTDFSQEYNRNSEIYISRKRSRNKPAEHRLSTEEERTRFAIDFTASPRDISNVSVFAKSHQVHDLGAYILEITNPFSDEKYPHMTFSLPVIPETVDLWTEDLAIWLIETHVKKEGVRDMDIAARNLGALLKDRTEIALGKTY